MTQKYYTERLLPGYIDVIKAAQRREPENWLLQEDGDPSHGMRKEGLTQVLKKENGVKNLYHSSQSSDLNPMEAY